MLYQVVYRALQGVAKGFCVIARLFWVVARELLLCICDGVPGGL